MLDSLWGEDFKVDDTKELVKKTIKKINSSTTSPTDIAKAIKSKTIDIKEKLILVKDKVLITLGKQVDNVKIIYDRDELHNYLQKGLDYGRIAIDTETNNSLDPITCKLMGFCLYVNGEKQVYVPINHVDIDTKERLSNQLTEQDVHDELQWLIGNKGSCKFVFHNGKFDYQVLKCTCNVILPIDWDTMIGAKLLDENEISAGLKQQYIDKIDFEQTKYDIESLFEHLPYEVVSPELFALYAATDSMMTDKLYCWQMRKFEQDKSLKDVYNLAITLEMPVIKVFAEMELNGITFDTEFAKKLGIKYHKKLDEIDKDIHQELVNIKPLIDEWRKSKEANIATKTLNGKVGKTKNEQLTEPINLSSPLQLSILLYDILKIKSVSKDTPRGTGVEVLEKLELPLAKLLLKRREVEKLINAFIDTLPKQVNVDGKIHCHFNQYGAQTGRTSSSNPNLQQVPSHLKTIRMLFTASPNCVLVGSDFSQQEVRLLAAISNDKNMLEAYKNNKDIYAIVASLVYHNKYEDNLEHYPDGTTNVDGKKRRSNCKSIVLGINYGRGTASIAEQIGESFEETQTIVDEYFKEFPNIKKLITNSQKNARKYGYVTDLWGRIRRLPDIQLPKYEIKSKKSDSLFNPILICKDRVVKNSLIDKYRDLLNNVKYKKDIDKIKQSALKDGIEIKDNSGFIAQAERQCANSIIQGSAASMTKQAMLDIYNDSKLNSLGFKLLLNVHDELIGECPKENAWECAKRLEEVMKNAAKDKCSCPFKCDADISERWYYNENCAELKKMLNDYIEQGLNSEEAFNKLCIEKDEFTPCEIKEMLK